VNRFYRLQGRPLLFGTRTGVQIGAEATLLGNPDFRRQQYGLVITSIPFFYNMTLTAHGGYQQHKSLASGDIIHGVYYGVSLLLPFGGGGESSSKIEATDEPP
jgi:hypothetical protein